MALVECLQEREAMTNRKTIQESVCRIAPRYKIVRASLFGSYARDEQTDSSDVDVLIDTDSGFTLLDAISFENELEDTLSCSVDVVSRRALTGSFRDQVLSEELTLYARA
ncbi:MAG: nucleotidyltransferase domain-containing protein [Eggerthellaceae bacterium]|nr:nucleotidyltransferase domain-containing protein [Eggerthellaceae bacterium]